MMFYGYSLYKKVALASKHQALALHQKSGRLVYIYVLSENKMLHGFVCIIFYYASL